MSASATSSGRTTPVTTTPTTPAGDPTGFPSVAPATTASGTPVETADSGRSRSSSASEKTLTTPVSARTAVTVSPSASASSFTESGSSTGSTPSARGTPAFAAGALEAINAGGEGPDPKLNPIAARANADGIRFSEATLRVAVETGDKAEAAKVVAQQIFNSIANPKKLQDLLEDYMELLDDKKEYDDAEFNEYVTTIVRAQVDKYVKVAVKALKQIDPEDTSSRSVVRNLIIAQITDQKHLDALDDKIVSVARLMADAGKDGDFTDANEAKLHAFLDDFVKNHETRTKLIDTLADAFHVWMNPLDVLKDEGTSKMSILKQSAAAVLVSAAAYPWVKDYGVPVLASLGELFKTVPFLGDQVELLFGIIVKNVSSVGDQGQRIALAGLFVSAVLFRAYTRQQAAPKPALA